MQSHCFKFPADVKRFFKLFELISSIQEKLSKLNVFYHYFENFNHLRSTTVSNNNQRRLLYAHKATSHPEVVIITYASYLHLRYDLSLKVTSYPCYLFPLYSVRGTPSRPCIKEGSVHVSKWGVRLLITCITRARNF